MFCLSCSFDRCFAVFPFSSRLINRVACSYMRERPVERDAPIIDRNMWLSIIMNGIFIAFYSILFLTFDPIQVSLCLIAVLVSCETATVQS